MDIGFFSSLWLMGIGLLVGSYTDFKTREVPDWWNYGLIISGIFLNLIYSIIFGNYMRFFSSIIGLVVFYLIALFMFLRFMMSPAN